MDGTNSLSLRERGKGEKRCPRGQIINRQVINRFHVYTKVYVRLFVHMQGIKRQEQEEMAMGHDAGNLASGTQ